MGSQRINSVICTWPIASQVGCRSSNRSLGRIQTRSQDRSFGHGIPGSAPEPKSFGPGAEDDDRDARHAGNGSDNRCRAGAAATTVWFVGGSDIGFLRGWTSLTSHGCCPVATKPHLQQASPDIFSTSWSAHLSAANDPPLHYSITSSAMASNPGGMAMPSVLAVWRLMMNSNLTARITGRSPLCAFRAKFPHFALEAA